jgi:hypothetical protein
MSVGSFQASARPLRDTADRANVSAIDPRPLDFVGPRKSISDSSIYSNAWTKFVECAIHAPFAWALIVTVGAIDCLWIESSGLSFGGWNKVAFIILVMWMIGFYGSMRGISRLADMGHHMALWVAFLAVNIVFTYLWATLPMPMQDATFAKINTALGFHWAPWFSWIVVRPWPRTILTAAYSSLFFQILGSVSFLALTDRPDRNHELLWTVMISALASGVISGFLPAIGPFIPGALPDFSAALLAVHNGTVSHIDVSQLKGIVTMPSFHTVLAILFTYAHRPPSRSFIPVAMLNLVMLISIPFAGHHYAIDMIAGAALAAATIAIVRAVRRSGTSEIVIASESET